MLARIWLLFLPLLAACSQQDVLEAVSTPQERALAEAAIQDVVRNDPNSLAKKFPPDVAAGMQSVTAELHEMLPARMASIKLVDARFTKQTLDQDAAVRRTQLLYELSGDGQYVLAEAVIDTAGNRQIMAGFHMRPVDRPVSEIGQFQISGKPPAHYVMLLAMVLAIGATIAALIKLWRSGLFARRWLWTLGCLVGFTSLHLDWSSGVWSFQPLSFKLLSASALRQGALAPWVLGVSVPLVAIIVLLRRKEPEGAES